ncbi:NERD domain-containing protein [Thiocapsa roseopersicina]|uniref:Nuclease-related domain-containing protein n=1 Tax=Thiocapsa roseopersicina TaxID=1058 RepID=A0A1H2ZVQ3_THIRO|nr:NERD domain-containing protein [Thiocapsa roseopersicina]SDX21426.1 Nuclease-related domain-containing protein [Thiocapsa roseopersicina]
MARIIPSDISPLALAGAHSGEFETLALLKAQLGPDYAVFHGVHWSFSQGQVTRFGEIDFILVNRAGAVLCIEQKNGVLNETPDGLVKVYCQRRKSVGAQIHRALDQVRDKFQWQHGSASPLDLDYLLYCPDYRVRNLNAAGLDQSRILDAAATDGLARRIERILGPGEPDPARRTLVEDFFCQTFEVVPQIHVYRRAQEQHFVRHGGGLAELVRTLEMTPFRVRVSGTGGCGKSLLAGVFARDQVKQGRRVLMICFNRPLADRLQNLLPEVHARTFYGFCDQFLRARGEPLDYKGMNQPGFWSAMQDRVLSAPIPDAWRFDVLILDEGQDFDADWLEILKLFLTEDARILWLDDPDQNLLGKPPVDLPGFVRLHSRHNYRSPYGIARFMRSHLPFDFEPANPLPGLGVGVHPYRDADDQAKHLDTVVADLLALGFAPDEIVILSLRGVDQSPLWKHNCIGRHTIRRFTGTYQPDGVQTWTDGDITLDSLYRFKGQDAPAIILTDVEDQKDTERRDRLLYCGMGRATVRVDVLVKGGSGIGKRLGVA